MKKYKKLIASILSFILVISALPGSFPVYAADQVYVDDPDPAGSVIKVADNGAELVHLNERIMTAGSETVYCIDINMDFESGYKTKHDAATEMSQEQITDIALCLEYIRQSCGLQPSVQGAEISFGAVYPLAAAQHVSWLELQQYPCRI